MAYAKKKDTNQSELETALRDKGFSVQSLHELGKGVPDLLLGLQGLNFLVEVKHDNAQLTEAEIEWHKEWKGQVRTAQTLLEVLLALLTYSSIMKRNLDIFQDRLRIMIDAEQKRIFLEGKNEPK